MNTQQWLADLSDGKFRWPEIRCVGRFTDPAYEAWLQKVIDEYERKKVADREFFSAITATASNRELPLLAAVREIMP